MLAVSFPFLLLLLLFFELLCFSSSLASDSPFPALFIFFSLHPSTCHRRAEALASLPASACEVCMQCLDPVSWVRGGTRWSGTSKNLLRTGVRAILHQEHTHTHREFTWALGSSGPRQTSVFFDGLLGTAGLCSHPRLAHIHRKKTGTDTLHLLLTTYNCSNEVPRHYAEVLKCPHLSFNNKQLLTSSSWSHVLCICKRWHQTSSIKRINPFGHHNCSDGSHYAFPSQNNLIAFWLFMWWSLLFM